MQDVSMSMKDRIKAARLKKGLTQSEVAKALGKSRNAVSIWEKGNSQPKSQELGRVAQVLGISTEWLLTGAVTNSNNIVAVESVTTRRIPIINFVQAGNFTEVISHDTTESSGVIVLADANVGERAFALKVVGQSMEPTFSEGDVIVVDPDEDLIPGCLVIASLNGDNEATFKKYRPRGRAKSGADIIELAPENDDYPTLTIDEETPGKIVGRVVRHIRKT